MEVTKGACYWKEPIGLVPRDRRQEPLEWLPSWAVTHLTDPVIRCVPREEATTLSMTTKLSGSHRTEPLIGCVPRRKTTSLPVTGRFRNLPCYTRTGRWREIVVTGFMFEVKTIYLCLKTPDVDVSLILNNEHKRNDHFLHNQGRTNRADYYGQHHWWREKRPTTIL